MNDYKNLITRKHLASLLTCSEQTIARYEKKGLPVVYVGLGNKFNKLPRYDFVDVMSWIHKMENVTIEGGEK